MLPRKLKLKVNSKYINELDTNVFYNIITCYFKPYEELDKKTNDLRVCPDRGLQITAKCLL